MVYDGLKISEIVQVHSKEGHNSPVSDYLRLKYFVGQGHTDHVTMSPCLHMMTMSMFDQLEIFSDNYWHICQTDTDWILELCHWRGNSSVSCPRPWQIWCCGVCGHWWSWLVSSCHSTSAHLTCWPETVILMSTSVSANNSSVASMWANCYSKYLLQLLLQYQLQQ